MDAPSTVLIAYIPTYYQNWNKKKSMWSKNAFRFIIYRKLLIETKKEKE